MDKFVALNVACMMTPGGRGPFDVVTDAAGIETPRAPVGIVPNWIGGSGIGKTARVTSVLKKAIGLNAYFIYLASKTPEVIGGFPANTPEGFVLKCVLPQVKKAMDDGEACIVMDEYSTAPPAIQATTLSLMNERTAGDYVLKMGIRFMMIMNPADDAANGHELEIPVANRVAHLNYACPSVRQWEDYKLGRDNNLIPDMRGCGVHITDNWADHYPSLVSATAEFLEAAGGKYKIKGSDDKETDHSKFYDQPGSMDARATGPWPSPRTWDWVVNGVATIRSLGLAPTLEIELVSGLVGEGLAVEWGTFMRKMDLPNPKDVLTRGWDMPKRLDVVRTVLSSCSTYVADWKGDDREGVDLAIACWKLLGTAVQTKGYADIAVKPMQTLVGAGFDITHESEALQDAAEEVCVQLTDKGHTKYL